MTLLKKFYSIPSSEGALGRNKGCDKAPEFLAKLLKARPGAFELKRADIEEQQKQIFKQALKAFRNKGLKVFFGGTHDITFSLFKAFAASRQKQGRRKALIIFDMHVDCDEGFETPSHDDFVRALVLQKIARPSEIMIFGAWKVFESERRFLKANAVKRTLSESKLLEFAIKFDEIYLSFDVDVLSGKEMKATHYLNRKGLSPTRAAEALNACLATGKVKALDIVELNPEKAGAKEKRALLKVFGFLKE